MEKGHVVWWDWIHPVPEWSIRLRREADEVINPSCLVPTVQACGGSVMIWGCFSCSGQLTTWIYWISRFFHQSFYDTSFFMLWIGHHRVLRILRSSPTLPSSVQALAEKWMQHWTEINVVTLHKLIKMMTWQMGAVVKSWRNFRVCDILARQCRFKLKLFVLCLSKMINFIQDSFFNCSNHPQLKDIQFAVT